MRITTIGRGAIGGTLGHLWTAAGHEVTQLGHDGGNAADADVVVLAVPYPAVPDALAGVSGLDGKVVVDTTNRLDGGEPPEGHASMSEYVAATLGGPVAKAFNVNFGSLLDAAGAQPERPQNMWVGDDGARAAVEQLSADAGMQAVNAGGLERAATQEAFAFMFVAIMQDLGEGPLFYRFAPPSSS